MSKLRDAAAIAKGAAAAGSSVLRSWFGAPVPQDLTISFLAAGTDLPLCPVYSCRHEKSRTCTFPRDPTQEKRCIRCQGLTPEAVIAHAAVLQLSAPERGEVDLRVHPGEVVFDSHDHWGDE